MPLGVRDVLLVIRAKDQASRAIGDVGRSFGNLGRKQRAILRESQKSMLDFNRQASKIRTEMSGQVRTQISGINTQMRQNSFASAQLATRNARLRQEYMNLHGASKRAALQEMLANDVRRKQLAEANAAFTRQATHIRSTSDRRLRHELGNIEKMKAAEMDLRRVRMEQLQARQDRGTARMARGQAIGGLGVGLTAGGVAGLAFFASAAKDAIKYRQEASKTLTQVDESMGASVQDLEAIGRRVARAIPAPFEQMQETLYEIFSSMEVKTLPQAEKLLAAFSRGAVAGVTDIQTAGSATIGLMNAFKTSDVNKVLDVQFATVKEGRLEYDEFARTIGRAIPSAVKAGQSMEDLGAIMAFLTRNSLSSAMAATSTARAFDLLSNSKFRTALKTSMNIEVAFPEGHELEGKFRPMLDVMTDLRARLDGLNPKEHAAAMSKFLESVTDPKALKSLEEIGIQIKNVADPKIAAQLKNNSATTANLNVKAAKLRIAQANAGTKEEKKRIGDQIRQIQLQKTQISATNSGMRANAKTAKSLRPVAEIMADLEEKLKSVTPVEAAEIMQALTKGSGGTIQSMRFVNLALTDEENLLKAITEEVRNSEGAHKKAYNIMKNTPAAKIQELKNNWKTFKEELGESVIPVVERLLQIGLKIVRWLNDLDDGTKKNIVKWGLLAAGFLAIVGIITILAGVIFVVGGALTILGGITAAGIVTFGLFAAGIAAAIAVGYLIIKNWDEISEAAHKLWTNIDDWLIRGFQFLVDKWLAGMEWIVKAAAKAFGWIPGIGDDLQNAAREIERFRDDVNRTLDGMKDKKINVDVVAQYKATTDFPEFIGPKIPKGASFTGPLKPGEARQDPVAKPQPRRRSSWSGGWPGRQHGGLVTAGKSYIVGERRAELFTPRQSGMISPRVPERSSTGGNTYNKHVVVNARTTATEQEIADEISWKLRER